VSHVINGIGFWPFWLRLPNPGPKPPDESSSFNFLLEPRLESESFEPLINFLGLQDQKL